MNGFDVLALVVLGIEVCMEFGISREIVRASGFPGRRSMGVKVVTRNDGFGLVEVMIVAAVISIIALGMSTLFTDMFSMQSKVTQQGSYANVRQRLIQAVQDTESWAQTLADGTNVQLACVQANTPCVSILGGVPQWYNLTLRYSDNTIAFSEHANVGGNENGFDSSGVLCTTFNAATPNAVCALSYDLQWHAVCPGAAATCVAPAIQVRGTARYASPNTVVGGINVNRFSFDVLRGSAAIRNEQVVIGYRENDSSGEGDCKNVAGVQRLFNYDVDPAGNATIVGGNAFQLQPGIYSCRVSAPAFKAGGVRILLESTAGTPISVVSPTVVASLSGGSAMAVIDTTLNLTAVTTLRVMQTCTNNPADDTDTFGVTNSNFSMGLPVPNALGVYTDVTYTVVSCLRTS